MPLNKSAVFLGSCNAFPAVSSLPPLRSITSSRGVRSSYAPATACSIDRHRRYATVNNDQRGSFGHNDIPEWPKQNYPSPYEIFSMKSDAPYTKHRFYQLVKVYHPDRHSHTPDIDNIPHAIRLERYRLIVAANDLLSDPSKRQLYDVHGVGWTGGKPQTLNETVRNADRAWRHKAGSAANNATWEDWERWYDAREGRVPGPMYMSNGVFATVVVCMCMIGAFAQMSRAEQYGADLMEMKAQSNLAIGQQVAHRNMIAAGRSKDERVDMFLKDRENLNYAFQPGKYDSEVLASHGHGHGPGHNGRP
ncbi:J domain-containing protein 1 [Fusarium irregulare]|uniref:J domain-containing protein 1 n=1 Tax=Fusarium irregulare TaxID=2494466 RepID=A0A9W8UGA8_9HYPO|nr:J domain-containing protein 1 [Fusarium irregulare]KAJ4025392.1 J domain-containing protein 1 [Fusarium irregulare]